jgi:hypothetical protein
MTDWWETPYAGGPMVKVAGFPRPLYPPDAAAHGKQPSQDGPDVVAYKRTVWRASRWPGPASNFDDSFSNNFSHGSGPNVVNTGVAGVQRQQHLDATGWIGEKTFNTLRSIRVPIGPHAGEMAMDARAADLINQAHALFGGHEPAPATPSPSLRQLALDKAITQLGTKESPSQSNNQKYGSWYGVNGVPWCAIFTTWSYETCGDSPSFIKGQNYAFVPYIVADARAGRNGLRTTDDPIPGDLVCYDWQWDTVYDHVGIFEAWQPGSGSTFTAIEGNTSLTNDSNGGEVMRRTRRRPDQSTVFVRVND